tara:strand:+ start:334 stop:711 length:378 start_codon:yes stop_codon:yes gene_type:complete
MALGNNFSLGHTRGKSKARVASRAKEYRNADGFHAISGSLIVPSGPPCDVHNGQVTETYYHNATNAGISASGGAIAGTHVFTRKRAHEDYYLPNGNYKVTQNGTNYFAIIIANGRIVAPTPEACK